MTAIPQGTAPGGRRRRHPLHGRSRNPPRGSHRTAGRVPTPFPPTEEGAAGGGQKGGAAAAPHADLVR